MQAFSKANGLDEAWVYGLTRQESRFVSYAKSGVGASGLMQVMPATAAWIAKKTGFSEYRQNMIHQTETNVKLGTYYLRYTLDLFEPAQDGRATVSVLPKGIPLRPRKPPALPKSKLFAPLALVDTAQSAIEIIAPSSFMHPQATREGVLPDAERRPRGDRDRQLSPGAVALLARLTERERDVMRLVVEGLPNKLIADQLDISVRTVEVHRARVFDKMAVKSAVELANLLRGE